MSRTLPPIIGFLCLICAAPLNAEPPRAAAKIEVDTSDTPELADFGKKVQDVADKWYPIIAENLPSGGFTPPAHVTIVFRKDYKGVAGTNGDRITAAAGYFDKHQDDVGAFVHELTHVVQTYHVKNVPGWLTEGIADYIRWFKYEPASKRPHPNPDKARYSDSYRTSAHFLNWAAENYDKDLVVKINAACRKGQYSEELWKTYTGKPLGELSDAWKESLRKGGEIEVSKSRVVTRLAGAIA
jgi:hypothetical protein